MNSRKKQQKGRATALAERRAAALLEMEGGGACVPAGDRRRSAPQGRQRRGRDVLGGNGTDGGLTALTEADGGRSARQVGVGPWMTILRC